LLLSKKTITTVVLLALTFIQPQPTHPAESAILSMSLGAQRSIPPDMLGITSTQMSTLGGWPVSPPQVAVLEASQIASVRFPGAFYGNYWDLEIGWLDRSLDVAPYLPYSLQGSQNIFGYEVPIEEIAALWQEKDVNILWLANMLTDNGFITQGTRINPVTDALQSKEAFLHSLAQASTQGLPIQYIELGHELHRSDEALPVEIFPDASTYGLVAADWEQAIHAIYPEARIAVSASDLQDTSSARNQDWNEDLAQSLTGEAGITAMAIHLYSTPPWNPSPLDKGTIWGTPSQQATAYAQLSVPAQIDLLLQTPYHDVTALLDRSPDSDTNRSNLRELPYNLWITEFNLWDQIGTTRHTWAHGLVTASFLDAFLQEPKITRVYLNGSHHVISTAFFSPSAAAQYFQGLLLDGINNQALSDTITSEALNASGLVLSIFAEQMHDKTSARQIIFSYSGTPLGLNPWGWIFSGGNSTQASILLTNPTAEQYDIHIELPGYKTAGFAYQQVYAPPSIFIAGMGITVPVDQRLSVHTGVIAETNTLSLPPYSITTFHAALPPVCWLPLVRR